MSMFIMLAKALTQWTINRIDVLGEDFYDKVPWIIVEIIIWSNGGKYANPKNKGPQGARYSEFQQSIADEIVVEDRQYSEGCPTKYVSQQIQIQRGPVGINI